MNFENRITCTSATVYTCVSLGSFLLPIQLEDRVSALNVLVILSLPQKLILGMDFWATMEIIPDM